MNKEREITIYDIADNLNLSIATVSRALKNDPVVNNKTKKRIKILFSHTLNWRHLNSNSGQFAHLITLS